MNLRAALRSSRVVALALAAFAAGCTRRVELVPASGDSSAVHSADSIRVLARQAGELWDASDGGEEAARVSAVILRDDLQEHLDTPWGGRAHALLDSLDIGAEIAADPRALAVNLFSRSHPEGGAWPFLYWRNGGAVTFRPISGRGLQLVQIATRGDTSWDQVAVLFTRRAGAGQEPLLMVWNRPRGEHWEPIQTLGADSLGGVGTVEFQSEGDTSLILSTRTFRSTPRFEECASCPHVYALHRFRWGPQGFVRAEDRLVPSPYAAFVTFVQSLGVGDTLSAHALVTDPAILQQAQTAEFGALPRGSWRAAPGTDENAYTMTFFRGQQEAYRVTFEPRGNAWLITSLAPTTRTIE